MHAHFLEKETDAKNLPEVRELAGNVEAGPGGVAYAFKPSTQEAEASLVYKVSSRTARTVIQRNPVLKKTENQNKTPKYKKFLLV